MPIVLIIGVIVAIITNNFNAVFPMVLGTVVARLTRHSFSNNSLSRPLYPLPLKIINILGIGLFIYGVTLLF